MEERIGEGNGNANANSRELVERLEEQSRSISELRGQKLTLADIGDEEGGTLLSRLRNVEQLIGEFRVSVANGSEIVEKLEDQGRAIASLRERRLTVTDIGDEEGGTLLKKMQSLEQKVVEAGSAEAEPSLVEKLERDSIIDITGVNNLNEAGRAASLIRDWPASSRSTCGWSSAIFCPVASASMSKPLVRTL